MAKKLTEEEEKKMQVYWDNIRKLYPKAFKELSTDHNTKEDWGDMDNPEIWGDIVDESHYMLRHLYDFFDSRGISLWVYASAVNTWHFGLLIKGLVFISDNTFTSRMEAELKAWETGFNKLENKW